MALVQKTCLVVAGIACVLFLAGLSTSSPSLWEPSLVVCCVTTAIGVAALPSLAGYQFTVWIITAVAAAMIYPDRFLQAGPFRFASLEIPAVDFRNPWLILIVVQLVMFGMGTKMSLRDFAGVAKMPYPVLVGISLQFLVMPLTGFSLAKLFGFPDEIAAGVVLIGSCSSGLASNVMCYLAGANLALSISLTAVATLLAPLATPFWMQRLAGKFVEVDAQAMMIQIVKIVIVPIAAAMLHDYLKNARASQRRWATSMLAVAAIGLLATGIAAHMTSVTYLANLTPSVVETFFILGGALLFALGYHYAASHFAWVNRYVHLLSMMGIVYFTAVTTAAGRDHLLVAGVALLCAAILHNLVGYTLGYSLSRLVGLDKRSALTVAFEVGMQNGGMASGLASFMGKLGTVGLAAAVFSPWMNVSGSILANQIRKRMGNNYDSKNQLSQPESMVESERVAST